jgi:kumamolisin
LPNSGTAAGCPAGQAAGSAPPNNAFTPNQYLKAYGHSELHRRGLKGQGQRIAVVEIDGFAPSDIATFGACFGIRIPPIHLKTVGIPGPLPPGDETTLDLEVLSATAPKAKGIHVYEGGASQAGVLTSLAAAVGANKHPDVISISLGSCEPALTGQFAAAQMLNRIFAVAAASGTSTLVSAGDQGSSACARGQSALALLAVSNPADSPYVTAVGGTNVSLTPENAIADEITWNDSPDFFATGGGFSVLYKTPWWQQGVKGSQGARLVPDIAALADLAPGYAIFCTAEPCPQFPQQTPGWVAIGGTSAAAPLMAGGVALANQAAARKGEPPLGHLNPLLYDVAETRLAKRVFRDVTVGSNDLGALIPPPAGTGEELGCCAAGRGYDLATGWGRSNWRG